MITHDEEQLNIRRLLYQKEERHLMEKLAKKKAKLKAAEGRIRARISARERKRRTRRLILIGSYMEHVTQTDPDRKARLMKGLDGFLERDRDRELFDLLPKEGSTMSHRSLTCCVLYLTVQRAQVLPISLKRGGWILSLAKHLARRLAAHRGC